MSTRTRFEKEAKGNSEMAYWICMNGGEMEMKKGDLSLRIHLLHKTAKQVISRQDENGCKEYKNMKHKF